MIIFRGLRSRSPFLGTNFFPENFQSRAFMTSHFLYHLIPTHSRLATSRTISVQKMKREFPNLKFCILIPEIPKIQYCSGVFLLGTSFQEHSKISPVVLSVQQYDYGFMWSYYSCVIEDSWMDLSTTSLDLVHFRITGLNNTMSSLGSGIGRERRPLIILVKTLTLW